MPAEACIQPQRRLPPHKQKRPVGSSEGTSGPGRTDRSHRFARSPGRDRHQRTRAPRPDLHHRPLLQTRREMASEAHLVVQHALHRPYRTHPTAGRRHRQSRMGGKIKPSSLPHEHLSFNSRGIQRGQSVIFSKNQHTTETFFSKIRIM